MYVFMCFCVYVFMWVCESPLKCVSLYRVCLYLCMGVYVDIRLFVNELLFSFSVGMCVWLYVSMCLSFSCAFVYLCRCLCEYLCLCVCMYISLYVCVYMCLYLLFHLYMCVWFLFIFVCMFQCLFMNRLMFANVCMCRVNMLMDFLSLAVMSVYVFICEHVYMFPCVYVLYA